MTDRPVPDEPLSNKEGILRGESMLLPGRSVPTNVRGLVLALACGISFLLYLQRYTWGFIKKDVQAEFGWDPVQLGWLDSLFPISYGVGQVPAGVLCDWFGAHALLGSAILLWSLALAGVVFAGGFAPMAYARLTFGATQAAGYPALSKVSRNWFPIGMRTTAQGLIATFFGRSGGAASFFLFGTVLMGGLGLGWRPAVAAFAVLGILCGVAFLLLFRNTPREHPWANNAEVRLILAGDPPEAHATGSRLHWGALSRSGTVWLLFVRAITSNMADVFFVYWMPLFLRERGGMSPSAAGWMAALPLVGGALGGLASGSLQSALIRRTGSRRRARATAGLGGKLLAAVCVMGGLAGGDPTLLACVFLVAKFFADSEQPAEWGTITDISGRSAATVFACVNTAGSFGGFIAGPLTGFVLRAFGGTDRPGAGGWEALFVLIAVEYVVSASCWLFIDPDKPIDDSPPSEVA
jgi:ACS family glucarate transporter-like MFS transporter